EAELAHYQGALQRIAAAGLNAEVSVKLTHLGLDIDPALAERHTECLAQRSGGVGGRRWIDMEASPYAEPTLALYRRVRARTAHVGVCVQAYLRRTADDVEALVAQGAAVRLVKGAYAEPATIAFPDKHDVDRNFLAL